MSVRDFESLLVRFEEAVHDTTPGPHGYEARRNELVEHVRRLHATIEDQALENSALRSQMRILQASFDRVAGAAR